MQSQFEAVGNVDTTFMARCRSQPCPSYPQELWPTPTTWQQVRVALNHHCKLWELPLCILTGLAPDGCTAVGKHHHLRISVACSSPAPFNPPKSLGVSLSCAAAATSITAPVQVGQPWPTSMHCRRCLAAGRHWAGRYGGVGTHV